MTRLEIIKETFNYYNSNPKLRADVDYTCEYLTKDGRMCAVGRCLINPEIFTNDNVGGVSNIDKEYLEDSLKPEYRGHPIPFWRILQNFHDNKDYWNEDEISEYGLKKYESLKELHKND